MSGDPTSVDIDALPVLIRKTYLNQVLQGSTISQKTGTFRFLSSGNFCGKVPARGRKSEKLDDMAFTTPKNENDIEQEQTR